MAVPSKKRLPQSSHLSGMSIRFGLRRTPPSPNAPRGVYNTEQYCNQNPPEAYGRRQ